MVLLVYIDTFYILRQDGLWGAAPNWSRELVTYICPSGYCDCSRGFEDGFQEVGCLLEYEQPLEICHETRTGNAVSLCSFMMVGGTRCHDDKYELTDMHTRLAVWAVQGRLWCWSTH